MLRARASVPGYIKHVTGSGVLNTQTGCTCKMLQVNIRESGTKTRAKAVEQIAPQQALSQAKAGMLTMSIPGRSQTVWQASLTMYRSLSRSLSCCLFLYVPICVDIISEHVYEHKCTRYTWAGVWIQRCSPAPAPEPASREILGSPDSRNLGVNVQPGGRGQEQTNGPEQV